MNIPNFITILRFLMIPLFILTFFSIYDNNLFYSMIIFLTAGFSDILDGYIAKKYNLITKLGIILDPLADKAMLITVLSCLVIKHYIPLWIVIFIIIKESSLVLGGLVLLDRNIVIPANFYGKLSTFLFYISIFIIVFNTALGKLFIYYSIISSFVAFINYLIIYNQKVKS